MGFLFKTLKKYLVSRNFILFLIIFISAFLRFYKAEDLFIFSGDEEHQMSLAYSIVRNFHIEWVGVSSADTGFYLGPFWIYFGAFWLFLSKGNPAILAYIAPIIGIITTILLYTTAKVMFTKKVALFSSLLYAVLPLIVFYDKKFWNPSLIPLNAILILLFLFLTKRSKYWWPFLFLTYGFAFHVHLSLVPLGLIIAFYFLKSLRKIGLKISLMSSLFFLLTISPLIFFDYFTKGQNVLTPLRIAQQVSEKPTRLEPLRHIKQLSISLGRLFYLNEHSNISDEVLHSCSPTFITSGKHILGKTTTYTYPNIIISILALILLVLIVLKRVNTSLEAYKLLVLFISTIVLTYIILPNIGLEYYLLGLFPLYLIGLGVIFENFYKNFFKIAIVALFIFITIVSIKTVLKSDYTFGLSQKRELIKEITNYLGESKFELSSKGMCHKSEGWRFLFGAYGKLPERSDVDENLGWIYKEEITNEVTPFKVDIEETRVSKNINSGYINIIEKGGFSAYIYEKSE